jgi:NAD(P)-dependent dehydrogenase (short-subunit alcohol dehydrogenase family)
VRATIEVADAVIAVTGVTSGIGRGIATVLTQEGANVFGIGRRSEQGKALEAELDGAAGSFHFVQGDMTSRPDAADFVSTAVELGGRLDVMINNVGTMGPRPLRSFDEIDDDFWRTVLDTNMTSFMLGCQLAIPALCATQGAIISVGSGAGVLPGADMFAYRAAKAGMMHLGGCLALDLEPLGVRVHTLVMGSVQSEGAETWLAQRAESMTPEQEAEMRAERAARAPKPVEVGAGIAALIRNSQVTSGPGFTVA